MLRPLPPLLLSLMAGIYSACRISLPDSFLTAALTFLFILLLASTVKKWKRLSFSSACLILLILGILSGGHDLRPAAGPRHISRFADGAKMTIEGTVAETPRLFPDRAELIIETKKIVEDRKTIPVEGRILLSLDGSSAPPEYGDLIRFRTKLKPPRNFHNPGRFDYEGYLLRKGVRLRGKVDKTGFVVIRTGDGNPPKIRLEKFRKLLRAAIRENAGSPEGEIIQAMVLGEQSEIPREVMDAFSRTGTTHIIAISGFNIGIIAAFSFFIIRTILKSSEYLLLRFNIIRVSTIFAFLPIGLYACIAGLGISVMRATIMIAALLTAVLLGKERDLANTLALAALIILAVSPLSLFDVSFQLSFAAVASILFIVPRMSALFPGRHNDSSDRFPLLKKVLNGVLLFAAVSLAAALGTAPLIVYHFNLLSPVTLLANLLIVPIMGYLVILIGMGVIITAPLSWTLTAGLVKTASYFTGLSIALADRLSALPCAWTFLSTPAVPELAAWYLFIFCGMKSIDLRREKIDPDLPKTTETGRAFLRIAFCLIGLFIIVDGLCHYYRDRHPGLLKITFIDVGQGNSALIDFPGGTRMLVDGGGFYDERFDTGRYVVAPYLWHEKINRIDRVVLSHPHPDHLNGLLHILEHFKVREVWSNGDRGDSENCERFIEIIEKKGIPHRMMSRDRAPVMMGGAKIEILHPGGRAGGNSLDVNDRSLVLKIIYGDVSILLPGDISEDIESRLVGSGANLKSRILLAPHHGSLHSSSVTFVRKVNPEAVVFSCGADNVFRLPHPEVLERYRNQGIRIFRTDRDGAVHFETDGKELRCRTFRES